MVRKLFIAAISAAALGGFSTAQADIVHNDDVIIIGSLCVGFDCVNGESFGFDTLRLKENNLRIHFLDTSNSASFPTVDWRIVANDSSNGGDSYLAFENADNGRRIFRVDDGGPANSLRVDDQGDVGIGTGTPVVELHVKDGDTPTLRLEQDGSSGFTPQTWDVAGNETNFFVRDATTGSRLPFRIRPAAPTNSIYVDTDGDIGLGTSSPADKFHVSRSGGVLGIFESTSNEFVQLRVKTDSTNRRLLALDDADAPKSQIILGDSEVEIAGINDSTELFATFNTTGLTVNGSIATTASGVVHPDYVFEKSYDLEPIDVHAAYMWENKHLKAIGPGTYNDDGSARIDLGKKLLGVIEELEKAHIYIDQLHQRLAEAENQNSELRQRFDRLEASMSTAKSEELTVSLTEFE